jgi:centrosomal protein CEP41
MSYKKRAPPSDRYNPDAPPKPLPKTNYSKRYADVKPVVDSGMTVPKLIESLKSRMPTGEIFRRIRPKKLSKLLALHAQELEDQARAAADVPAPADPPPPSSHHMHSSVVFNDGPHEPPPRSPAAPGDCPFLLLDCRDEEEFENCHITNAKCYPKARLSRATGQFTQELLAFRGRPDRMIVLYCDFGQTSGEAAQQFAERGFDNVFLLHGGLADFAEEFPDLVGPNQPPPSQTPGKKPASAAPKAARPPAKKQPTRAAMAAAPPPGAKKAWK